MGQYEPDDSRNVTNKPGHEPGGIERTGPREGETRTGDQARRDEARKRLDDSGAGEILPEKDPRGAPSRDWG